MIVQTLASLHDYITAHLNSNRALFLQQFYNVQKKISKNLFQHYFLGNIFISSKVKFSTAYMNSNHALFYNKVLKKFRYVSKTYMNYTL